MGIRWNLDSYKWSSRTINGSHGGETAGAIIDGEAVRTLEFMNPTLVAAEKVGVDGWIVDDFDLPTSELMY